MNVDILEFQEIIWQQGRELYRDMPWRADTRPYYVMVSEIMLQQTQVDRVVPKFEAFIQAFPSVEALSKASLAEVLQLWSGLGYNRRAKFLHEAAKKIVGEYEGVFPSTLEGLTSLPGIGINTAGAILAYSFNARSIFIETNVRTVYFYHFFSDKEGVTDTELKAVLEATIDSEHPREWYWSLMDYGTYLKRQGISQNNKSHHYKKQSPLKGSVREVRGQILKLLTIADFDESTMKARLDADERFDPALRSLLQEGLIGKTNQDFHLMR